MPRIWAVTGNSWSMRTFSAAQSSLPFQRDARAVQMFTPALMSCPCTQRKPVELTCNCSFWSKCQPFSWKFFSLFKKFLVALSRFHHEFVLTLCSVKPGWFSICRQNIWGKNTGSLSLTGHSVNRNKKDVVKSFRINKLSKNPNEGKTDSSVFQSYTKWGV